MVVVFLTRKEIIDFGAGEKGQSEAYNTNAVYVGGNLPDEKRYNS